MMEYVDQTVTLLKITDDGIAVELWIDGDGDGSITALSGNVEVGYIDFKLMPAYERQYDGVFEDDNYGVSAYVEQIYVYKDWQKLGIGSLLFETLACEAVDRCLMQNRITGIRDVIIEGGLSVPDYLEGEWEKSVPFCLRTAEKLMNTSPMYESADICFGIQYGIDRETIAYDSRNPIHRKQAGQPDSRGFCRELVEKLYDKNGGTFVSYWLRRKQRNA